MILRQKSRGELPVSYFAVEELEAKELGQGVEIRVISGERMTMVFSRVAPWTPIPQHSHPYQRMGTVLKGSIELAIEDEKRVVQEGRLYPELTGFPRPSRHSASRTGIRPGSRRDI
jgi:quercetin dioxygenase-like cupin family protein